MSPSIESNQEGHNQAVKQGDGRLSVTLLGLAMAAAAAVVFQLTFTYIDTHDSLAHLVPADAVFYLHINADRLEDGAADMLLPENIRADEIAKFAVVNRDKGLSWGALFAWRRGHQPTADERRLLGGDQALQLNDGAYLMADDDTVRNLYAAERTWASLADDDGTARSLAAIRGLTPIQGYLNPIIAPPQAMAGAASFLKELDPLVFGADPQEDGYFAVTAPIRTASSLPLILGFGVTRRDSGDQILHGAPASVRLISDQPAFDPLSLFFGKIEKARAEFGPEDKTQADQAADELRRLLNDSSVTLSVQSDERADKTYIGAEYPAVRAEQLAAAVAVYLSSALPERTSLMLPDGDLATEFRLDKNKYLPTALAGSGGQRVVEIPALDFKLILKENGRGGIFLATDEIMIERMAGNDGLEGVLPKSRCATVGGRKLAVDGPLIMKLGSLSGFSRNPLMSGLSDLKFGLIIENSDGVLVSCGYR